MAVDVRHRPRHSRQLSINNALIALSVVGITLAFAPILVGVVLGMFGRGPAAMTAFATAAPGSYVVYATNGVEADVIYAAPADDPSAALEIATVAHVSGNAVRGAASPGGDSVALIVATSGTQARPASDLVLVDLESGDQRVLAPGVDSLQDPMWGRDGSAVFVTRGGDVAPGPVRVVRIDASSGEETVVQSVERALGMYPVAVDPEGRLVTVVIDGAGSTVYRDGAAVLTISGGITRDWSLSPDGSAIAFIETLTEGGVTYRPAVLSLDGSGVQGQSLVPASEALGTAWPPAGGAPAFGVEAGVAVAGAQAQGLAGAGLDVPIAYSNDGEHLAVQAWTGDTFDAPGDASYELVSSNGRVTIPGATRFLGWAER